jgi:LAO/AO transport system kinase
MAPKHPSAYYIDGVLAHERRILAKAITLIESSRPDHQELAREVLDGLLPHAGGAIRLGITGVPGAGKSTFIESIGRHITGRGHRLAVLAIDPSSRRSGGSVLADKTRMETLSMNPAAFIRPSPAGTTLGGVAAKTRESMLVCEAAGFDVVIVETVGVGQSETAVAGMVDFFLVLMIAGAGDEIQGIKKGLMELADAVAINKADGDNIQAAERARRDYLSALHLLRPASQAWSPPVLTCSALSMQGIDNLWQTVLDHRERLSKTGELQEKRRTQALDWMWSMVEDGLKEQFHTHAGVRALLPGVLSRVAHGTLSPGAAARELLGACRA